MRQREVTGGGEWGEGMCQCLGCPGENSVQGKEGKRSERRRSGLSVIGVLLRGGLEGALVADVSLIEGGGGGRTQSSAPLIGSMHRREIRSTQAGRAAWGGVNRSVGGHAVEITTSWTAGGEKKPSHTGLDCVVCPRICGQWVFHRGTGGWRGTVRGRLR